MSVMNCMPMGDTNCLMEGHRQHYARICVVIDPEQDGSSGISLADFEAVAERYSEILFSYWLEPSEPMLWSFCRGALSAPASRPTKEDLVRMAESLLDQMPALTVKPAKK